MNAAEFTYSPGLPPEVLTAPSPRILWIELSSKCPFDCIFCSRKTVRGSGEFMDFPLYQKLIASLEDVEIIRLNYSGESIHHPHLMEAIALASGTGAFVELVTALSSLPLHHIEPLVRSGLDRLTVSIHTLDAKEYEEIYRFSSSDELNVRLEALRACQTRLGTRKPVLDFAFVAMDRNLKQLEALAHYAHRFGVRDVFVHPLIRRDEIPVQFPAELDGQRLKPAFLENLRLRLEHVENEFPGVRFPVSTQEIGHAGGVTRFPRYYPGPLPAHARIFSCDQSPWDSVHILANGDVVSCEVRDRAPLGNLHTASLQTIWHGTAYKAFRNEYQTGRDRNCRDCTYKLAYLPGPVACSVTAANSDAQELISGWHSGEGDITWSKRRSRLVLAQNDSGSGRVFELTGLLPPGEAGCGNALTVTTGGQTLATAVNHSRDIQPFSIRCVLPLGLPAMVWFDFVTRVRFCPRENGSEDVRELGFALQQTRLLCPGQVFAESQGSPIEQLRPLLFAWQTASLLAPWARRIQRKRYRTGVCERGISILIPERATPDHLECCLISLSGALAELNEPCETIVSLNGTTRDCYSAIAGQFPAVRWLESGRPLGFGSAIQRGLKEVRFGWVYLLNSDMLLQPSALRHLLSHRAEHVFALASQIFFADRERRREETGWTGFRMEKGCAQIFDRDPHDDTAVRPHLYAGGGSSLFQTDLLRRFSSDSPPYNPMYFEDAEWGVRAWREGFETLFVPASQAIHAHRATVNRLFSPEEADRIFRRNQLLFSLRNGFFRGNAADLAELLSRQCDPKTLQELSTPANALSLIRVLFNNARSPMRDLNLSRFEKSSMLHTRVAGCS